MEIFKTTAGDTHLSWQTSQTEAAEMRKELAKTYAVKPETQTINIPTAKGPLVAWLNANVKG